VVSLILKAAQERCLYIEIGSAICLCSNILGKNTKKKRGERQYWVYPVLAVRYLEGSFYTLFEKVKSHDSKFFNYFRMSVSTFEFLVMRLSDHIKGQDTPMRVYVPPKEMLAVTIR